ncbi:MAG TPA: methionyl-tRNA formyltransferase [Rubrobacteraceae bacterium]|nr:methionyl-tRNA formyltransferase [Rubrobacteraceae bacterium]
MKLAFAGTPQFAATILSGLLESDHEVGLVISQPDARRGRGRRVASTPVADLAHARDLPLRQPERISEAAAEISDHDALIVAAYGQILRPDTLYAASHGAWNVHASLLPAYRGAAPVERAIMAGEQRTGVTIMQMDEGLDTGPMALQRETAIPADMTGGELTELLARLGSEAVVESMSLLETGSLTLTEQDSLKATYAAKLSNEDRVIKWDIGADEVHNIVRALAPYIGARTFHEEYDGPVRILRSRIAYESEVSLRPGEIYAANGRIFVGCGRGVVEVLEIQAPGGRALPAANFLRGNALGGRFRV